MGGETLAKKALRRIFNKLYRPGKFVKIVQIGEGGKERFMVSVMPDPKETGGSHQRIIVVDGGTCVNDI